MNIPAAISWIHAAAGRNFHSHRSDCGRRVNTFVSVPIARNSRRGLPGHSNLMLRNSINASDSMHTAGCSQRLTMVTAFTLKSILLVLCFTGCSRTDVSLGPSDAGQTDSNSQGHPSVNTEDRLTIVAVNYPLAWMAEQIGGDQVRVLNRVPEGTDPALWQPTPEDVLAYQSADLILLNGDGYADWVSRASLPASRCLDTTRLLAEHVLRQSTAVTHRHGPDGDQAPGTMVLQTWVNPQLAILQAESICQRLESLQSETSSEFRARFSRLKDALLTLDAELEHAFASHSGARWIGTRSEFLYLGERYHLNLNVVDPEHLSMDDKPESLKQPADKTRKTVLLCCEKPTPDAESAIDAAGLSVMVFDTGAARPTSGDYLTLMQSNVQRLRALSLK